MKHKWDICVQEFSKPWKTQLCQEFMYYREQTRSFQLRGAVNTPEPSPPHLCTSTFFFWGVLQLLSCSILCRLLGLEVCGQGRALKAPALGALGQACEEGVRGRGGASFSIFSHGLVWRLPAFSSGVRACLKSGPRGTAGRC